MKRIRRGSVWVVDLGLAAKVRPCLVISVPFADHHRALVTIIPHTTRVWGTEFEVPTTANFLKAAGVFDVQQLVSVPPVKLIHQLGELSHEELSTVEVAVRHWLDV